MQNRHLDCFVLQEVKIVAVPAGLNACAFDFSVMDQTPV